MTRSSQSTRTPRGGNLAVQIFGELLITLGLVLLLFVAWQLWWTNISANATQDDAVTSLSQEFAQAAQQEKDTGNWDAKTPPIPQLGDQKNAPSEDSMVKGAEESAHGAGDTENQASGELVAPPYGQAFGVAYIPRFGLTYQRPIAEGTGTDVLDTLGLGHYQHTALPGQEGNFALAGHRQTNGAVLDRVEEIQQGDHIYVQTVQGYYTYTVYETKIVDPTDVGVIAPDPDNPTAQDTTKRLLTLTTCHPRYGDTHRYVVHASFDSWRPLSAGAPDEIKAAVGQ